MFSIREAAGIIKPQVSQAHTGTDISTLSTAELLRRAHALESTLTSTSASAQRAAREAHADMMHEAGKRNDLWRD